MRDAQELEVATDSAAAVTALDHFREQMLSLGPSPERVLDAASDHPDCALLQTYAAVFHLYGMTEAGNATARDFLDGARAAPRDAREDHWAAVVEAWIDGNYEAAMDRCEAITERWPRDLLAAKVAEFHYYATGQHWQAARFLAHMERIHDANQDSSHFLAMHAFALELSDRFADAEAMATRAIEHERITPWAHHCLGHVYTRQGRFEEGERVLRDLAPAWDKSGQPIRGHNGWHLALFPLARLDLDEALRIYRSHVSGFLPDSLGEQVDAISLLWRIELAGRALGDEWNDLADHVEPHADECFIPFVAAHEVWALTRAGREAAAERKRNACLAATKRDGERGRVWRAVGRPLVEGCAALARGDAKRAVDELGPILAEVGCVGGSDAQDDVFRQAHLVALLRAGEGRAARAQLDTALQDRRPSPLEAAWAAQL